MPGGGGGQPIRPTVLNILGIIEDLKSKVEDLKSQVEDEENAQEDENNEL